jgi:GT2 family glycosyltransferase
MSGRPRATGTARTVAVLICSYRRPEQLLACLGALAAQTRPADEVIIAARSDDSATRVVLEARPKDAAWWRIVPVGIPGLVAARNAGLAACRSDIVAFCDDDTRAHPEWVARILAHFARDPELGGLGGRDRCHNGERFDDRRRDPVGRLQWFGRAIGNHHLGHGAAREVQFLKGANMSFRMQAVGALRFDARLRGCGAQPHDDLGFSLAVWHAGWRVLFDPAVTLDHFAFQRDEPRAYVAGPGLPDPLGYEESAYNHVLALWDALSPAGRVVFALWSVLVGMRVRPGLLQALRLTPREGKLAWRKLALHQRGCFAAYATLLSPGRRLGVAARTAR